jgi:asparagine synthetase B (glutamine-hydrolysing)
MSLIAGIHSIRNGSRVPEDYSTTLRRLVGRNPELEVAAFGDGRTVVFAHSDPFRGNASFVAADSEFSVLAGETLCRRPSGEPDRGLDLADIHGDIANGRTETLKRTRGTFCGVSVQNGSLTLFADKIGVRQMFYWIGPDYVVFSSALWVIEQAWFVPLRLGLRGAVEQVALGYPLADRTPFECVYAMRAGEVVQFRESRTLRCRYWKWDEVRISEAPEEVHRARVFKDFGEAVRIRLGADRGSIAFLSGGLDSRCVVAALRNTGCAVHTFNFARPGTKDLIFGARFADRIGAHHTEVPKEAGDDVPDYSAMIADAWRAAPARTSAVVENERLVWSGEGGSVALGHVHLGRGIAESMRERRVDEAIDRYFDRESVYVSPRLFRRRVIDRPLDLVRQGISEELAQFSACDPARNFYLFLLLNDQRRKLHRHFENIDLHGIEFQLPFFDANFIRSVLEVPVDNCLEHRFYTAWIAEFQPAVSEVPWQSYPGHVPCPVAGDENLSDQWDRQFRKGEQKAAAARLHGEARAILSSKHFPTRILHRPNLRLAYLVHRSGVRDYGYLIEAAGVIERLNRNCD